MKHETPHQLQPPLTVQKHRKNLQDTLMGLKHSKLSKHAACGEFLQYYSVVVGGKRLCENPEFVFFFLLLLFLSQDDEDNDFQHGSVVPLASHPNLARLSQ